ncbi:GNAT family N-acetyltransferase [Chloroflexota bacterium]
MTQNEKGIKIRKMVEDDLPRVNAIDRSLFSEGRVTTWPFPIDAYLEVYHPKLSFVAELEGELVGFLMGVIKKEERSRSIFSQVHRVTPASRGRRVGWIDMVGIRHKHWHKGVARALVEAFQNECKRKNAIMRINVRYKDKDLKEFLVALGFKRWGIITYQK